MNPVAMIVLYSVACTFVSQKRCNPSKSWLVTQPALHLPPRTSFTSSECRPTQLTYPPRPLEPCCAQLSSPSPLPKPLLARLSCECNAPRRTYDVLTGALRFWTAGSPATLVVPTALLTTSRFMLPDETLTPFPITLRKPLVLIHIDPLLIVQGKWSQGLKLFGRDTTVITSWDIEPNQTDWSRIDKIPIRFFAGFGRVRPQLEQGLLERGVAVRLLGQG